MTRSFSTSTAAAIAFIALGGRFGESRELTLRSTSERPTSLLFSEAGGVVQRGPGGAVYFLSTERRTVSIVAPDGSVTRLALADIPERELTSLMEDLAVDHAGRLFIPAIWRYAPKRGAAGVYVFNAQGIYERTIEFATRTNVRHIAIDDSGAIFVLGVDPAYFRGIENNCFLIHKYTPDGKRVTAFSDCPVDLARGRQTAGPAWDELNLEVDRGQLWLSHNRLYQLLPSSHQIRIFDPVLGTAIGQVNLGTPAPSEIEAEGRLVWRIVQAPNGRYVAQWSLRQQPIRPEIMARRFVLGLHDAAGRNLSSADAFQSGETIVPLFANADGSVTFAVGQARGSIRLTDALVTTQ